MPRQSENRLTDAAIRKAKPKLKPYKLFDGKGLFVVIHPNGGKYFRWRYRMDGKERMLALGVYPVVTLFRARELRLEAQRLVDAQIDPIDSRKRQRAEVAKKRTVESNRKANTFRRVAEDWTAQQAWSDGYAFDVLNSLKRYVYPEIGDTPISEVTRSEVRHILLSVQEQGKTVTARRVHMRIRLIFRHGLSRDWCERNPAAELEGILPAPKVTPMMHVPREDFGDYLRRLESNEPRLHHVVRLALKFLILTFVRSNELRLAKWPEIDFKDRLWRIPGERMKSGDDHLVPLSRQAVALLQNLLPITGDNRYVFSSHRNLDRPMGVNSLYRGGIAGMGCMGAAHLHGFRTLASSILNESGKWHPDAIERQLAHSERDKTRAAYNRSEYLLERRKLMQWWADRLDQIRQGGEVVDMTQARTRRQG